MPDKIDDILEKVTALERKQSKLSDVSEWVKIIGGVILGLGGVITAALQYSYSQSKLDSAKVLTEAYEKNNERLKAEREDLEGVVNGVRAKVADAEESLTKLSPKLSGPLTEAKIADVRADVAKITAAVDAAADSLATLPDGEQSESSPKRVFLHIAGEPQRASAAEIAAALAKYNFIVPGTQNVEGRGYIPDMTEVRYFRYPRDKQVAADILAVLQKENGLKNARISYVNRDAAAARSGHIEIWFERNAFTK